jgi:predicted secreted protein
MSTSLEAGGKPSKSRYVKEFKSWSTQAGIANKVATASFKAWSPRAWPCPEALVLSWLRRPDV